MVLVMHILLHVLRCRHPVCTAGCCQLCGTASSGPCFTAFVGRTDAALYMVWYRKWCLGAVSGCGLLVPRELLQGGHKQLKVDLVSLAGVHGATLAGVVAGR